MLRRTFRGTTKVLFHRIALSKVNPHPYVLLFEFHNHALYVRMTFSRIRRVI